MPSVLPMKTYPQGSLLWPRKRFTVKTSTGRLITGSPGQSFWVTNTSLNQSIKGVVEIARSGSKTSQPYTTELAEKLFDDTTNPLTP